MWLPEVFHTHPKHKTRSAEYDFDKKNLFKWNWMDLIAALRNEDIDLLCHGDLVGLSGELTDPVRSGGLLSCRGDFDPNSKDYALEKMLRHKAEAEEKDPPTEYPRQFDFVFERSDGICFTLHPKHDCRTIPIKLITKDDVPAPAPKRGIGKSDGKGTFRRGYTWRNLPLKIEFRRAVSDERAIEKRSISKDYEKVDLLAVASERPQ